MTTCSAIPPTALGARFRVASDHRRGCSAPAPALKDPEVSIVLTTQGRRETLGQALRSALAQTGCAIEVVLVDDSVGSPGWRDASGLKPLLTDPRVRIIPFHVSRGCAAAKNAGLRAARGDWVCYLDDDNEYRPGKVRAQLDLARITGSPVVLCGLEILVRGRRLRRQVRREVFAGDALLLDAMADTNVIFHRRDEGLLWDDDLRTVDDACFFQALVARHALSRVPNLPRPLVTYRSHGGQRANRNAAEVWRGLRRLVFRWAGRYSPEARRTMLLRALIVRSGMSGGGWGVWAGHARALFRAGGARELRFIANSVLVRVPVLDRWAVT